MNRRGAASIGGMAALTAVLAAPRAAAAPIATGAPMATATMPSIAVPRPGAGAMAVFSTGETLLWNDRGQAQTRSAAGAWSPVIRIDAGARQVVADPVGFLILATRYDTDQSAHEVVVLLDSKGTSIDRWESDTLRSIGVAGGKRWATALGDARPAREANPLIDVERDSRPMVDKLLVLAGGGRIEEQGPAEQGARIAAFTGGKAGSLRVDCVSIDRSKGHFHPAYCAATGVGGWRKTGSWDLLPFPCGPYLIEVSAGEGHQVTVRRLDDGGVVVTRPTRPKQVLACGHPGELLVGLTDVQGWSLPALKPLWRARAPRGSVTALARAGDQVLVTTASGRFATLLRPPASDSAGVR